MSSLVQVEFVPVFVTKFSSVVAITVVRKATFPRCSLAGECSIMLLFKLLEELRTECDFTVRGANSEGKHEHLECNQGCDEDNERVCLWKS